ncbi:hypothetical protein AB0I10_32635 [Streptomyces sp. NPDC050636]|uniref:hypothetical protein n=1 Tax=Streptomyces sp. NPDC050636 TaxID=3154510 RepID=UPI00342D3304
MQIPGSSARRAIRGLTGALLSLLLGCVSHVSAGGRLPGPEWLAVTFAVLAVAGVGLTRRRRAFDVLVLVLGGAQSVLHIVLHTAATAAEVPAVPSGHLYHHGGMASGTTPDRAGTHYAVHDGAHVMSAGMTLAHGAAALGTAVCLVYGDRLLRRLAAMIVPRFRLLRLSPFPAATPRLLPCGPLVLVARYGVLLACGLPRRGPPLPLPA